MIISESNGESIRCPIFICIFCGTQVHQADNIPNLDAEQRLQQVQSVLLLLLFFPQEQHDLSNFIKSRSLKHVSFIK